jgi:hypothetical protein
MVSALHNSTDVPISAAGNNCVFSRVSGGGSTRTGVQAFDPCVIFNWPC